MLRFDSRHTPTPVAPDRDWDAHRPGDARDFRARAAALHTRQDAETEHIRRQKFAQYRAARADAGLMRRAGLADLMNGGR